ncbi:MAG: META and DUF4377 domain-containing protein [Burkholderiaceae bacterium]|nr:META and DUF4377 domain-containing protein [Burkholderiaceae bacterium]
MKRSLLWLTTAISLQGLVACAVPGDSPTAAAINSASTLSAYHWQMQPDFDANREPVQLTFQGQRLAVQGLCNHMGASYAVDGQKMTITQGVSTMRMCDDPALMAYEQKLGKQLEQVKTWGIANSDTTQAPRLTLNFDDGQQWTLTGKQTYEAQYGEGVTEFLEVQPQLAPCHHPLIGNKECLQVRSITYDASGIKQSQGDWQLFYDDIAGYKHVAGVRNILRVKRYTRSDVPADASRYVYVLDMTVESENVR